MRRVLTASALIPVVVYMVFWANFWVFVAVVTIAAFLCYQEFNQIVSNYGFGNPSRFGYGYGVGLLLLVWGGDLGLPIVAAALIALTMAMRSDDQAKSVPLAAMLFTGIIYVFGCWHFAVALHEKSPHWLMFALLLNWAGDSGAYFVGRAFGRHKLAPRVSPNKSWEGAAASVATAAAIAGAYLVWAFPGISIAAAVGLTALANAAGQVGDLAESALKRGAGVKDSGTILPGHGGLLDRVDSTLFALPVIYAYLKWLA
jgi:phosphatidate cytidylyltransferase